jgi:chondroitin AC lyase
VKSTRQDAAWLPIGPVRSDRDLDEFEVIEVVAFEQSTGALVDRCTFATATDYQRVIHRWPKFLGDEVNQHFSQVRMGQLTEDGKIVPIASAHQNQLWVPQDQSIRAFTTARHLDNWVAGLPLLAKSPMIPGSMITVTLLTDSDVPLESWTHRVEAGQHTIYRWPNFLCQSLNRNSSLLLAGTKDPETRRIVPLSSQARNVIWIPDGAPLNVQLSFALGETVMRDMDTVAERAFAMSQSATPSAALVDSWLQGFASGRFADIDYPAPGSPVKDTAPLTLHLSRIKSISMLLSGPAPVEPEPYRSAVLQAIDFYVASDFKPTNWWDRQIGLARVLAASVLRLAALAPAGALGAALDYLARQSNVTDVDALHTGGNLADFAAIQAVWCSAGWRASQDPLYATRLYECTTALELLCLPVSRFGADKGEGISVDGSFSQHNVQAAGRLYHQLYTGAYGKVYLSGLFAGLRVLTGAFALEHGSITSLKQFVATGPGWQSYAGLFDWQASGRSISRGMTTNRELVNQIDLLDLQQDTPLDQALSELRARAETASEQANVFYVGSRLFWVNDYLAHLNRNFGFWAKAVSTRTVGTETGNGENLKGYYMGAGSYFLLRDGGEYRDVQPVWDWLQIPGTTVEQDPNFAWPLVQWGNGAWGSHDFVGGACDTKDAVLSMVLSRQRIQNAYKTVCVLDQQVIALGSGIDAQSARYPVQTTVNQCLRRGPVAVQFANLHWQQLDEDAVLSDERIVQIRHDGVSYHFPESLRQRIKITSGLREGAWRDINTGGSPEPISARILSIGIEHDQAPGQYYEYRLEPTPEDDQPVRALNTIRSESMHWVFDSQAQSLVGTCRDVTDDFWMAFNKQVALRLLHPAALVARLDQRRLSLTVADPTQTLAFVDIQIREDMSVRPPVRIPLPTHEQRGASVTVHLNLESLDQPHPG